MEHNPIEVIGTIEADHNWLTMVYLSGVTHITAWHFRPIYYLASLDAGNIPYQIVRINEENNDLCWSCGTPVEKGERFCNAECAKSAPQPSLN